MLTAKVKDKLDHLACLRLQTMGCDMQLARPKRQDQIISR